MSDALRLLRSPEAALCYHVLAHLDLGRDAASVFDATLPDHPWVAALREAYLEAPGRLGLQMIGLRCPRASLAALCDDPPASLSDEAGRRLLDRFFRAAEAEREVFMAGWERLRETAEARLVQLEAALTEPLQLLRGALWERMGAPPPLTVLDCPALDRAGRGASTDHGRVVAVCCQAPLEHLLCQILHEEIHPVTDPLLRKDGLVGSQDTRAGSPGYTVHAALERTALEVGEALILARAPRWAAAYRTWRARFERVRVALAPAP